MDHAATRELLVFLAVILLQPTVFRFLNIMQSAVCFAPFLALVEGYTGFYLLGYLLGTRQVPPKLRRWIYALGIGGMIGGTLGNYLFSSPEKITFYFSEGYSIMQYLTAGALFLWMKEHGNRLPPEAARRVHALAGLTFGIYFVHVLVLDVLVALLGRTGWTWLTPAAQTAVDIGGTWVLSTAAAWVLSRIPVLRRLI